MKDIHEKLGKHTATIHLLHIYCIQGCIYCRVDVIVWLTRLAFSSLYSINEKKICPNTICSSAALNRSDLIALALLLGCDYCPQGMLIYIHIHVFPPISLQTVVFPPISRLPHHMRTVSIVCMYMYIHMSFLYRVLLWSATL